MEGGLSMGAVTLELPYPPTLNTYWRNIAIKGRPRVLISARGRQYRQDVAAAVFLQYHGRRAMTGRLAVEVELHPPDRRVRDIDNAMKASLDSLAHAGVFENDGQIDRLTITRHAPVKGGRAVVRITTLEGANGQD
jgi:crossover junction endodeoxyribonuclease RusA